MSWFVLVESNTTGSGRLFCARARELGLRPVVLARDPERYPYLAADQIDTRVVDTGDPAALSAVLDALDAPVSGITSSSEYFIATAAELARDRHLPHPDPESVRRCRDKSWQRQRLHAAGVPGADFAAATTATAAVAAAGRIGYPVVVKPVSGSGSVATRRCVDPAEVAAAAQVVLATPPGLPPQEAVLVEEYLAGTEYSVETFDEEVVGVTRKHLGPEPHFVEVGHDFPAPLPPGDRQVVAETALAALRALGLGWGPAHVELRLTPTGPRVVEVNPRLAGGMIPRVVQEAVGVDLIELTVARAAGQSGKPAPTEQRCASIRFLVAPHGGRLAEVTGVAAARAVPGVVQVEITRAPGSDLVLRHSFQDRLGYVLATGTDHHGAATAADTGRRALAAWIVPADQAGTR